MTYSTAEKQLDTCRWNTCSLSGESMRLHQPVLACVVRKTCQHYFCKRQERGLKGYFSMSSHGYILFFSDYVHILYTHSHLASFLYSILCATAACISMPYLGIDTSRRVAFSQVFLKNTDYSVSQIKNSHRQIILNS